MLVQVVKSKIHRVKVTGADLNYIGSITIDEDLMDAANIIEGERVQVVNNNNGERLETYVIPGPRKSGEITLNGAAARRVAVGDVLILITYDGLCHDKEARPRRPRDRPECVPEPRGSGYGGDSGGSLGRGGSHEERLGARSTSAKPDPDRTRRFPRCPVAPSNGALSTPEAHSERRASSVFL